jgi:hypothetical protein
MYCGQCGKVIPDGTKFCAYCGMAINQSVPVLTPVPLSTPGCEEKGCNYIAFKKCFFCGRMFCQKHIGYSGSTGGAVATPGWMCKTCSGELVNKINHRVTLWGTISLISTFTIVFSLFANNWNIVIIAFFVFVPAVTVWLNQTFSKQYLQGFYKKNFR